MRLFNLVMGDSKLSKFEKAKHFVLGMESTSNYLVTVVLQKPQMGQTIPSTSEISQNMTKKLVEL